MAIPILEMRPWVKIDFAYRSDAQKVAISY